MALFCSDAVSTSSSSIKSGEPSSSAKYNNIFKSAFNRGITFLSKIANSSGSNTPTTSASTGSKPAESEINHDSSSSETPSNCSSPDSLKTEMIFFKPITREPRTPSSTKPVLLRVPSIHSTASSTDRLLNSPCPSPFFIPITPRRQSAFSFVTINEEDSRGAESEQAVKPRPSKRKNAKTSPEKSSEKVQKRVKNDEQSSTKTRKTRQVAEVIEEAKTEKRKTRSMEKRNYFEDDDESFCLPAAKIHRRAMPKSPEKKSPQKKQPAIAAKQPKRVLRSNCMKH